MNERIDLLHGVIAGKDDAGIGRTVWAMIPTKGASFPGDLNTPKLAQDTRSQDASAVIIDAVERSSLEAGTANYTPLAPFVSELLALVLAHVVGDIPHIRWRARQWLYINAATICKLPQAVLVPGETSSGNGGNPCLSNYAVKSQA